MRGEYPLAGDVRNRLACHVECFRRDMKAAYDRYDADMKGIKRYKGSTGYSEEKAKLDAKLKEKTDAIKTEYDRCFQSVLYDLKNKIDHIGLAAPTNVWTPPKAMPAATSSFSVWFRSTLKPRSATAATVGTTTRKLLPTAWSTDCKLQVTKTPEFRGFFLAFFVTSLTKYGSML